MEHCELGVFASCIHRGHFWGQKHLGVFPSEEVFISLMPRHVLDTTTMKVLISRTGKLRLPRVSNTNCEEHSFLFLCVGRQTAPRHTAQSKGTWIGSGFILSCRGLDNLFGEYLPIEKLRVNVDKDDTQNLTVSKWQSFYSALNLVGFKEH